jgi:hypothetical protein
MRDKEERFKTKDDNQVSVVINMLNGITLVTDDHNEGIEDSLSSQASPWTVRERQTSIQLVAHLAIGFSLDPALREKLLR